MRRVAVSTGGTPDARDVGARGSGVEGPAEELLDGAAPVAVRLVDLPLDLGAVKPNAGGNATALAAAGTGKRVWIGREHVASPSCYALSDRVVEIEIEK